MSIISQTDQNTMELLEKVSRLEGENKTLKGDLERIGEELEFEGDTTCEDILYLLGDMKNGVDFNWNNSPRPKVSSLEAQVVALQASEAKLTEDLDQMGIERADNTSEIEKLFKFITGGGEAENVEEIIREKMTKEFIDSNQEHWDQMELFQEEGSDNVIDTLKEEVDLLEKHNDEYRSQWEDALADGEEYQAENEKLKAMLEEGGWQKSPRAKLELEIKKLKATISETQEYWVCLMDCRNNPENPDKDEIDEWCDANDKSQEVRKQLYEDFMIEIDEEED